MNDDLCEDMVLRICGQDVRVDFCVPGHWAYGAMGRSSIKDGVITINKDMRGDIRHATILHEILHFIADTNGLMQSTLDQEHTISVLACSLHAFMRDHGALVKEICDYGASPSKVSAFIDGAELKV